MFREKQTTPHFINIFRMKWFKFTWYFFAIFLSRSWHLNQLRRFFFKFQSNSIELYSRWKTLQLKCNQYPRHQSRITNQNQNVLCGKITNTKWNKHSNSLVIRSTFFIELTSVRVVIGAFIHAVYGSIDQQATIIHSYT